MNCNFFLDEHQECKLKLEGFTQKELQKLPQILHSVILQNSYQLNSETNFEQFISSCIQNSFHVLEKQKQLGKSQRQTTNNELICSFCNEFIQKNQFKRTLPCFHTFHKKCIDKWIFNYFANSCPCCQQGI